MGRAELDLALILAVGTCVLSVSLVYLPLLVFFRVHPLYVLTSPLAIIYYSGVALNSRWRALPAAECAGRAGAIGPRTGVFCREGLALPPHRLARGPREHRELPYPGKRRYRGGGVCALPSALSWQEHPEVAALRKTLSNLPLDGHLQALLSWLNRFWGELLCQG